MLLKWFDGATAVDVEIELRHGVALDSPRLSRRQGTTYVALPAPESAPDETSGNDSPTSRATWRGVTTFNGAASLDLQLYWRASDPVQPTWRYTAVVTVTDPANGRLVGRLGYVNPTVIERDLTNNWDQANTAIVVS